MVSKVKVEPTGRRLTRDLIKMGTGFRKLVTIKAYGGVDVKIRPLMDEEFNAISAKLGYGIDEALGGVSFEDLTEDEIKEIRETGEVSPSIEAKIKTKGSAFSDKFGRYMKEMCRIGIVPETEEEDVKDLIDLLIGQATIQIGAAILAISYVKYEELIDFFAQPKGQSSQSPSLQEQDSQKA